MAETRLVAEIQAMINTRCPAADPSGMDGHSHAEIRDKGDRWFSITWECRRCGARVQVHVNEPTR